MFNRAAAGKFQLVRTRRLLFAAILSCCVRAVAADAPPSPNRPWISAAETDLQTEAKSIRTNEVPIDPAKSYSLGDLIDLAENHNPETRLAWEHAREQAANLEVARANCIPLWRRLC